MTIMTTSVRQTAKHILGNLDRLLDDPDRRDTLRVVTNRLDKVAESVEAEERKIQQNPHLTPAGQLQQRRALAAEKVKELQFLQDALAKANTSHQTMTELLFTDAGQQQLDRAYDRQPAPLEADPMLRHMREQEIRMDLRLKTQPERDAEYLRAVQAGDRETVRALSTAPGRPLVTPDMKSRADVQYAQRQFPAAYQNYVQVDALREQLVVLSDLTTKWLDGLGIQS